VIDTLRESLGLLATRRFGTFWFASLLSSIGTWAQQVAEPWLLLTLGASSFLIGLDSFAMNAPVLLLTLVGGVLADRSDRRRVIAVFQSIQMLCPTAIIVLLVTGHVQAWMIIALSVVVGVTDALSMPSFQSIVPSIVSHEQIGRGLALNSTQFSLSRILGPAIAGVLISSVGVMACFFVSAASYVPFIGVALWVLPRWTAEARGSRTGRTHPFAGVGDILRQQRLRGALLTVLATSVLCAPLVTFSPVLVKNVFHGDAGRFSIAVASFGAGGLLGAAALLGVASSVDRRRLSSNAALAYGVVLVLTALDPWFWGLPPLLVLGGALMTVSSTAANSLLQATARPHLLGQTVSLYMLAMRGGISLGALVTGAEVSLWGVQRAFLVNGVVAVVVQLVLARLWFRASESGRPLAQRPPEDQ
jgi:MFS family permease